MSRRRAFLVLLLAAPSFCLAAPPAAQNPAPKKPLTTAQLLAEAEKALPLAGNDKQAAELAEKAESLRRRGLTGASRLLLSDSRDALGKHDFQGAQSDLDAAIALQPDQPILRRDRAAIRLAAGDNDGAIADLGVFLDADPGDPTGWAMLSQAERERHEPDAALRAYREAIRLNPHLPGAQDQLKEREREKNGQED